MGVDVYQKPNASDPFYEHWGTDAQAKTGSWLVVVAHHVHLYKPEQGLDMQRA